MIIPVDYTRTILTEIPNIFLKHSSFSLTDFTGLTTEVNLAGKNGLVNIVSMSEDNEFSCLMSITSAITAIEVGVGRSPQVMFHKSSLNLPRKLGELTIISGTDTYQM